MSKETNRTEKFDRSRVTTPDDSSRVHPLMKALGQYSYAAICLPFLRFLQSSINPSTPFRILFLIVERSWATLVPPAGYKGDGKDRRGWMPSLTAVREVKQTRYGHWIIEPLRVVDVANILGIDEGNVSNGIRWLEARKAITVEARRFVPCPTPALDGPKKLCQDTTFWSEHPLFQQLETLRLQIEAELEEAKKTALEPVIQKYRPKLDEVNTQQKNLKRDLKKAAKTSPQPEKVVAGHNLSESITTKSTKEPLKARGKAAKASTEKVVAGHNLSKLSPIPQVVDSHNFQPALNVGSKYPYRKNNNNTPAAPETDGSVVVAPVLASLLEHGTTTEAAARKLAAQCQAARPGCTAEEIVSTIGGIAAGFSRSTKNPVGVLLTQVPKALKTADRKPPKRTSTADELAAIHSLLNDPTEPEDHKALYRKRLAELEQQSA